MPTDFCADSELRDKLPQLNHQRRSNHNRPTDGKQQIIDGDQCPTTAPLPGRSKNILQNFSSFYWPPQAEQFTLGRLTKKTRSPQGACSDSETHCLLGINGAIRFAAHTQLVSVRLLGAVMCCKNRVGFFASFGHQRH